MIITKFYIYKDTLPLYWDEDILEFDTYESAERFLASVIENSEHPEDYWTDSIIVKDEGIRDSDENYLNATNMIVIWDYENETCDLKEI